MSEKQPTNIVSREVANDMYADAASHINKHYGALPPESGKGLISDVKKLPSGGHVSRDMNMEYVPPYHPRHNRTGGTINGSRYDRVNIGTKLEVDVSTQNSPQNEEVQYSSYRFKAEPGQDWTGGTESKAPSVVRQYKDKDGNVRYYDHEFKNADKAGKLILRLAQKRIDRDIENSTIEQDEAA